MTKFYQLSPSERRALLKDQGLISETVFDQLNSPRINGEIYNHLIENYVMPFVMPEAVIKTFSVNQHNYLIPLVTEESSVVAGLNKASSLISKHGGFVASSESKGMWGQIVFNHVLNFSEVERFLNANGDEFFNRITQNTRPSLEAHGGGYKKFRISFIKNQLVIDILFNVGEAMGANMVNELVEAISEELKPIIKGKFLVAILSNDPIDNIARAKFSLPIKVIGEEIVTDIISLNDFAATNKKRSFTHNKGILNGVEALLLATGNDTRAVSVGIFESGQIPTNYYIQEDKLIGEIQLPLLIGAVGGLINALPQIETNFSLMGNPTKNELMGVIAAVGLAQNFAALLALSSTGINEGHMKLHATNIAISVGAVGKEINEVGEKLTEHKRYETNFAKKVLTEIRGESNERRD